MIVQKIVSIRINALEMLNQDKLLLKKKTAVDICGHACHGNLEGKGFQEWGKFLCQMSQE